MLTARAHRDAIAGADLILVLEGGRVVESGTHDGLMARAGTYFRLVGSQAGLA